MFYHTDDVRINGQNEVIAPQSIIDQFPLSERTSELVYWRRAEASDIVWGRDPRLLVVVGPCSIHDPNSALDYAQKLRATAAELKEDLCILMRVYFEKPRTTVGWKGLLNDPHLNGSFNINDGLLIARQLLRNILEIGLGVGTEYLDPITPQYIGDLLSWSAIGARTTQSQIHRQLASGLSCPVGFKNTTHGDIASAAHAVESASASHIFLSVTKSGHTAIFSTSGNNDCHVVLRGGDDGTNYDHKSIQDAGNLLRESGLNHRLMVDMSHANSNKVFKRQLAVCDSLCEQLEQGETCIMGVMIESNLVEGNQSVGDGTGLVYGQSITDACIGWDDTVACLKQLAEAARARKRVRDRGVA